MTPHFSRIGSQCRAIASVDLDASQTAVATRLNRNTINRYLAAIRERVARCREAESPASGGVGVDEGCFGPRRVKGARGRGDREKTTVSGLFGRNGRVYAEIAPDCSGATLQATIRGRTEPESVLHSDGRRGCDGLAEPGCQKHFRVEHSNNEFAGRHSRINGTESFRAFRTRTVRFRGLHRHTFCFHLKECEFRFNHRQEEICRLVLKMPGDKPLC